MSGHGRGWQEVGDRVFRFRYRSLDLNVGAVLGDDEVLVVDTRSFAAEAAELVADLRALTRLPCRQVVNTHAHFDHCFGNATLRPAAIWGHERCAAHLRTRGDRERAHLLRWLPEAAGELDTLVLDPPWAGGGSSCASAAAATPTTTWWWSCPTRGWCSPGTWSRRAPRPCTAATRSRWRGRPP